MSDVPHCDRTRNTVQSFFPQKEREWFLPRRRYRLATKTLAVHRHEGGSALLTIPQGSVIAVDVPTTEAMVAIEWEGKQATMFAEDLHARGIPLEPTTANQPAPDGFDVQTPTGSEGA